MRSVQVEAVESFSTLDADVPSPRVLLRDDVRWNAVKVFSKALHSDGDLALGDAVTAWLALNECVLAEVVVAQSSSCISIVLFYRCTCG